MIPKRPKNRKIGLRKGSVVAGDRDWDPLMPDAEVVLNYNDKLELDFEHQIRAMKRRLNSHSNHHRFLVKS